MALMGSDSFSHKGAISIYIGLFLQHDEGTGDLVYLALCYRIDLLKFGKNAAVVRLESRARLHYQAQGMVTVMANPALLIKEADVHAISITESSTSK